MSQIDKIHEGEYGFDYIIDTGVDLSGHTAVKFRVRKPDGTTVKKTGSADDVKNGVISWHVADGDFDSDGTYKIQGVVEFSSARLLSDILTEDVSRSL